MLFRSYLRQFIGILHEIQGLNVTPDAADQIELINDDQVNAWLRLSQHQQKKGFLRAQQWLGPDASVAP